MVYSRPADIPVIGCSGRSLRTTSSRVMLIFPREEISDSLALCMLITMSVAALMPGSSVVSSRRENRAFRTVMLSTRREMGSPVESACFDMSSERCSFPDPISSKLNEPSLSRTILTRGESSVSSSIMTFLDRSGRNLYFNTKSFPDRKSVVPSDSLIVKSLTCIPFNRLMSTSPICTFLFSARSASGMRKALTLSGVM